MEFQSIFMETTAQANPHRTRLSITALSLLCLFVGMTGAVQAEPTIHKVGLILRDGAQVMPGYVLHDSSNGTSYLVDTFGEIVNEWSSPIADTGLGLTEPLPNGNVLAAIDSDPDQVVEMDFAGNVVWEYIAENDMRLHHDFQRMPNGNTLLLCSRDFIDPAISPETITDDCLILVNPDGQILWDWQTADHFADFEFDDDTLAKISSHAGDWAHANSASLIPEDTSHTDPRFRPGNIIISYRFINRIVIVDRDTGAIVWVTDNLTTIGQHDATMIPDQLSGGGNILVFDNGFGGHYNNGGLEVARNHSRVLEIDPTLVGIPETDPVVYNYHAVLSNRPDWWFSSWFISSAQRLPNGNTLIDDGATGRMFEVTPKHEIVWEYISPHIGFVSRPPDSNRVYRANKVPLSWFPQ